MNAKTAARGFTLIELLVVTGISVLLMTVMAFIYSNALKVYNEAQGLQEVYQTSQIINRDFRDAFSNVVAVPGNWITPKGMKFAGTGDATDASSDLTNGIDFRYLKSGTPNSLVWPDAAPSKAVLMTNNTTYNTWFVKTQRPQTANSPLNSYYGLGYFRGPYWLSTDMNAWKDCADDFNGIWAWWMPGFFGKRDATVAAHLENDNILAGSWGWPRPDYRMDVDADDPKTHNLMSCWFYSEYKLFNSPSTLTLDNANIVLVSIKFTKKLVAGKEETQLSFLRHQIVGNDTAQSGALKEDQSLGSMIRKVKITPWCMDAGGQLRKMDDNDIGADTTGAPNAGGNAIPRCFDIEYTLRNKATMQTYNFALRVFCRSNPQ